MISIKLGIIALVTCFVSTAINDVEGGFIIRSYERRARRSKERNVDGRQRQFQKDTLLSGHHNANEDFQDSKDKDKGMAKVVMVQTGFGCCHGRDATKASIRAVRNAIDSNSVKVRTVIPGGYDNLKIHLQLGIPQEVMDDNSSEPLDMDVILKELPYGTIVQPVDVRIPGGLIVGTGTRLGGM